MRNQRKLKFNLIILLTLAAGLALFALAGCNAKPYDYEPTAGEMKPGPGVFTGESGKLTIYDSKKGGFFLIPADDKANNRKVFVVANSVTNVTCF